MDLPHQLDLQLLSQLLHHQVQLLLQPQLHLSQVLKFLQQLLPPPQQPLQLHQVHQQLELPAAPQLDQLVRLQPPQLQLGPNQLDQEPQELDQLECHQLNLTE